MRHSVSIAVLVLCVLFSTGCTSHKKKYKLATGAPGTTYNLIGEDIAEIWREEYGLDVEVITDPSTGPIANCKKIANNEVDFAIIQDDAPLDSCCAPGKSAKSLDLHLRTMLPLYPEVLFVVYRNDSSANPKSLATLLKGKRVGLGPHNSPNARFVIHLFDDFGIDTTQFTAIYTDHTENTISDSIDVCCTLAGFNSPRVAAMIHNKNGKIFPLDDYNLIGKGSSVDGFSMKYETSRPFVIPKYIFGAYPEQPILTVAVDAILIAHKETDNNLVYELTKILFENEQALAHDNVLFSFLSEKFDPRELDFPLHEGAEMFLQRNSPSYLETHSDTLGFVLSAIIAVIAVGSAVRRWLSQRKKDRIDEYYKKVMEIESQSRAFTTKQQYENALDSIQELRQDAFNKLIDEKLEANESFRIFHQLLNDTMQVFQKKAQETAS